MTVVDRGRQMRSSYRRHAKCPGFTRARALCSGEGLLAEKVSPGPGSAAVNKPVHVPARVGRRCCNDLHLTMAALVQPGWVVVAEETGVVASSPINDAMQESQVDCTCPHGLQVFISIWGRNGVECDVVVPVESPGKEPHGGLGSRKVRSAVLSRRHRRRRRGRLWRGRWVRVSR